MTPGDRNARLLVGRLRRRYDGISRLLLSAEHLQNLLRGSGPSVGLVRVRLLLLVRYICAGRVGLSRLSGLGLIVGIVVGVFLFIFVFAIVGFGCGLCDSIAGLRDDDLLVERLRLRKPIWGHRRRRIILIHIRRGLGLA